jgi:hypothetical protein
VVHNPYLFENPRAANPTGPPPGDTMTALCRVSISQAGWSDPTYDVASFCLVCDLSSSLSGIKGLT